jgi:hypothetical protein
VSGWQDARFWSGAACPFQRRSARSLPLRRTGGALCCWLSGAAIGSMRAGGVVEVRLVVLGVCLLERLLKVARDPPSVGEGDRP